MVPSVWRSKTPPHCSAKIATYQAGCPNIPLDAKWDMDCFLFIHLMNFLELSFMPFNFQLKSNIILKFLSYPVMSLELPLISKFLKFSFETLNRWTLCIKESDKFSGLDRR